MRIVIASANFERLDTIGSSRPRSFARWLARSGNEVTVIARPPGDGAAPVESIPGVRVLHVDAASSGREVLASAYRLLAASRAAFSRGAAGVSATDASTMPGAGPSGKGVVLESASLIVRIILDLIWASKAERDFRRREKDRYDVVISSYGPFGSLWLGWRLATVMESAWVSDFRDLIVQDAYPAFVNRLLAWHQARAVNRADATTTISDGLLDQLRASSAAPNRNAYVHLLRNGFESSPTEHGHVGSNDYGYAGTDKGDAFRIGYTGNMYRGRRDASALFSCLKDILEDPARLPIGLEVHYAGKDGPEFVRQASMYGLDGLVVNHGLVTKSEAQYIQRSCDLLLVLSWNTSTQPGILTGKVFEYMQANVPVVALTGGDRSEAELSKLVRDLDLGFAFEYVRAAQEMDSLREFLTSAIASKGRGERSERGPNDRVSIYEYATIVKELECICLDLIEE